MMRLQSLSRNDAPPSLSPRVLSSTHPSECAAGDDPHKAPANNLAKLATSRLAVAGFRALLYGSILILASCGEGKQVFPGEGPVVQFVRQAHWLSVYGSSQESRSEMIRMEAFVPFEPGFSPRSAVAHFGEPQRVIPRERGAEYVEYMTSEGRFRLGSEESADGYVGYPLYFHPIDRRPDRLFPATVLRHMRLSAEKEVVMLFECGYTQPFMHAILESGQIESVVWLSERELGRRSSPEQCTD